MKTPMRPRLYAGEAAGELLLPLLLPDDDGVEGLLGEVLGAVDGVSAEPPGACGRLVSFEFDLEGVGREDGCEAGGVIRGGVIKADEGVGRGIKVGADGTAVDPDQN